MKKKIKKAQMGLMLESMLESADRTKATPKEKVPTFKTEKEHIAYYKNKAVEKFMPEDQQFYNDIIAGKVTNIDADSFIALKNPTAIPAFKQKKYLDTYPEGNVLGRNYYGSFQDGGELENNLDDNWLFTEKVKRYSELYKNKPMGQTTNRDEVYLRKGLDKIKKDIFKEAREKQKVIETNRGQWDYPGQVTKVNSNNITMKGVLTPVLGVSDKGDTQLMFPNLDYKFDGNSVTEYPLNKKVKKGQMGLNTPAPLNWGSENVFAPGQFTQAGQFNQFANRPTPEFAQGPAKQNIGEKLGGLPGILNTATSLVGGLQMMGQAKEQKLEALKGLKLAKLTRKAANSTPERVERKYWRPEDQLIDPQEMNNTYGAGTNFLAKDGAKLQNGGFLDQFTNLGYGKTGNIGQMLGSAIGGGGGTHSGAGIVGSTIGGAAGSLLGPLGKAAGSFIGGAIGGIAGGRTQKLTNRYNRKAANQLGAAAFESGFDSIKNQYTGFMQEGGEMPMNGQLQTQWGGEAETVSVNPYLPSGGESILFKGQSHDNGGIGVNFGGNKVEVEGGEPAVKLRDGGASENLVVFGNMKIPDYGIAELGDDKAKGKKFKNYVNDLNESEAKQNKLVDKNMKLINDTDMITAFDKLKMSSGKAMLEGTGMNLKEIARKKEVAANVQNAILETAEEMNLDSDSLAKGKIKKAKKGTYEMAQDGKSIARSEMEKYLWDGWKVDPTNANRLMKTTVTDGKSKTVYVGAPGKGSEEFNKAFAQARQSKKEEFTWKGKKYTTDLYKGNSKTVQTPGSEKTDYLDIVDPQAQSIVPTVQGQPVSNPQTFNPEGEKNRFDFMSVINAGLPYLRPTNQVGLNPNQLAGERYALSTNQLEPVQAQLYNPLLEQVSDISLQDQMNANQADFNAISRQVDNPGALASLAAQKYQANSQVLGEQFRFNQAQRQGTYNKNRGTLNDAQLKNLGILDQQYVRQSQAKSNTKATAQLALNSISSKIQQNKLENRTLGVYENLYNYRYLPNGQAMNLNQLADFQFPSNGQNNLTYLDSMVPQGSEPEFNSRGQLKDVGRKQRTPNSRNGSLVKAIKDL